MLAFSLLLPALRICTQRVLSTDMVECRVSMLGKVVAMIWGSIPIYQYLGPFGVPLGYRFVQATYLLNRIPEDLIPYLGMAGLDSTCFFRCLRQVLPNLRPWQGLSTCLFLGCLRVQGLGFEGFKGSGLVSTCLFLGVLCEWVP